MRFSFFGWSMSIRCTRRRTCPRVELALHLANPDDLAAALREVEELAAHYLADLESGIHAPDPPRRETVEELERLRDAADALSETLRTLSEPTRERLTQWVSHTREHAPDE